MDVVIYGLTDPETNEVRYVGKSVEPHRRLRAHIQHARNGGKTYRDTWIRSLLTQGLLPRMVELQRVESGSWQEAEAFWISHFRKSGNLTNLTDGGDGPNGFNHSEETKQRLSEHWTGKPKGPFSEEHRKRISEGAKEWHERNPGHFLGRTVPEETRQRISETLRGRPGRPQSEETRAKLSEAMRGRSKTLEHRRKIAESLRGRQRPRTVEEEVL